jgi:Uncharacterized conserved protein
MTTDLGKKISKVFFIILGNFIYALAVVMFILPNQLITGGTTGLGLVFQHGFGISLPFFVLLFNVMMFIFGAVMLGKTFVFTTMISSICYPVLLSILQRNSVLTSMTQDKILATILGGLMIGIGIGLVIRVGASTGGMDIPPLVLNKKLGIPISFFFYTFDIIILLLQIVFADKEQILYGILLVFIYTIVLDRVLLMGQMQTQVKIISEKYNEINQMIVKTMDRGCTLINAKGGYLQKEQPMILTVVSNRQLGQLNQKIAEIDSEAFIVISRVNEVSGRGFSLKKNHVKEK